MASCEAYVYKPTGTGRKIFALLGLPVAFEKLEMRTVLIKRPLKSKTLVSAKRIP